jgi:hypothetical protein
MHSVASLNRSLVYEQANECQKGPESIFHLLLIVLQFQLQCCNLIQSVLTHTPMAQEPHSNGSCVAQQHMWHYIYERKDAFVELGLRKKATVAIIESNTPHAPSAKTGGDAYDARTSCW